MGKNRNTTEPITREPTLKDVMNVLLAQGQRLEALEGKPDRHIPAAVADTPKGQADAALAPHLRMVERKTEPGVFSPRLTSGLTVQGTLNGKPYQSAHIYPTKWDKVGDGIAGQQGGVSAAKRAFVDALSKGVTDTRFTKA